MNSMTPPPIWEPQWQTDAVEIVSREILFHGHTEVVRYQLRHPLFKGEMGPIIIRERIERRPAAAVLLYDPKTDQVVLIEQFRVGALKDAIQSPWLLEVVAGLVDTGETPAETAVREAQEEAGCTIKQLIPIIEYYPSPGGFAERTTLFCGLVEAPATGGIFGQVAEVEDIRVHVFSFEETMALFQAGAIHNGSTIIAVQWLALHRNKIRENI